MKRSSNIIMSDFYCTKCGQKGLPVWRKSGSMREAGHLKKLFCFNCNEEVNHVECKPFTKYTYEDFLLEFKNGNFTKEGNRFSLLNDNDAYFSKENEVWSLFVKEIIDGLKNYDNTIVDATHLNAPSRLKTLNAVGEYLGNVRLSAIVIRAPFYTCIKRNESRTGRAVVPVSVIRRMNYQFDMPTSEEGFNDVIIIDNSEKE